MAGPSKLYCNVVGILGKNAIRNMKNTRDERYTNVIK